MVHGRLLLAPFFLPKLISSIPKAEASPMLPCEPALDCFPDIPIRVTCSFFQPNVFRKKFLIFPTSISPLQTNRPHFSAGHHHTPRFPSYNPGHLASFLPLTPQAWSLHVLCTVHTHPPIFFFLHLPVIFHLGKFNNILDVTSYPHCYPLLTHAPPSS